MYVTMPSTAPRLHGSSSLDNPLSPSFTIFPAIDLREGKVVRLAQGDPQRQTRYGDDPLAFAELWKAEGAAWLHVVSLDSAFGVEHSANRAALQRILSLELKVQFGGGLRDRDSIRAALEAGVSRAVIGTAAVENPSLVDWALETYGPERVAVGIDARDGLVRIKGWTESTSLQALDLGRSLRSRGLVWCILTDISRDGLQTGVNLPASVQLADASGLQVIASGGVASVEDVSRVRAAGLAGVIIGRALYEGKIQLRKLWVAMGSQAAHCNPQFPLIPAEKKI
jgi:phosphoribosylformimino-5-aminoimidazole carboxamide ribotide isomerase